MYEDKVCAYCFCACVHVLDYDRMFKLTRQLIKLPKVNVSLLESQFSCHVSHSLCTL